MAGYDDWDEGLRDLWNNLDGTEEIPENWETDYSQNLFDIGFGHSASEYDALGITPADVHAAREEFFDYMGMADDQFDWAEWREYMGYE